jgi:FixJ family two-component response regulator
MTMEANRSSVFIVGGDDLFNASTACLFEADNLDVRMVPSASQVLSQDMALAPSCIVLDARKPGTSFLQFQSALQRSHFDVPLVCVTDDADLASLSGEPIVLTAIRSALSRDVHRRESAHSADQTRQLYARLTPCEREVMKLVSRGLMNKQIAWELGVSERTVKAHRGNARKKMGSRSLAELIRMLDAIQPAADEEFGIKT